MMKKAIILFAAFMATWVGNANAQEFEDSLGVYYVPKIQGMVRAKYEYNASVDGHRFQVRNARVNVTGNICPIVRYKAEIDLSDEGNIKMLDAWMRYTPISQWDITIGQQKVPFSTENLRSPYQYYFANRSFIGKQMSHDVRDVGLLISYTSKGNVPFILSAGTYNGNGIYNQKEWQNGLNYAARAVLNPNKNLHFSLSLNSVKPEDMRMNLYNASVFWQIQDLHLEAEYVYKTYEKQQFADTHAALIFACYDIKTPKIKWLQKISPAARYDLMTDSNRGKIDSSGLYAVDDAARQRVTGGVTFALATPFLSTIRINYEQYFYHADKINEDNKLVVECCVKF